MELRISGTALGATGTSDPPELGPVAHQHWDHTALLTWGMPSLHFCDQLPPSSMVPPSPSCVAAELVCAWVALMSSSAGLCSEEADPAAWTSFPPSCAGSSPPALCQEAKIWPSFLLPLPTALFSPC